MMKRKKNFIIQATTAVVVTLALGTACKHSSRTGEVSEVDTYNMPKQPNAFSRWFNTSDARLKKSLVAEGLPTTADSLQYPSKASHSIVMVLLK